METFSSVVQYSSSELPLQSWSLKASIISIRNWAIEGGWDGEREENYDLSVLVSVYVLFFTWQPCAL